MTGKAILYPLLAMFVLVCLVGATMLARRIAFYRSNRVHPQKTATSVQMAATITDSRAADNFRNLFETPVLFYVAVLTIFAAGLVCTAQIALAWSYVATRYLHSYLQCSSNIVMRRFYAFLASCALLSCMWLMLAYQLISVA
jgi:hypothetical protein